MTARCHGRYTGSSLDTGESCEVYHWIESWDIEKKKTVCCGMKARSSPDFLGSRASGQTKLGNQTWNPGWICGLVRSMSMKVRKNHSFMPRLLRGKWDVSEISIVNIQDT